MVLNLSFIPLVYFCYPETKGVTLEQIDHIFLNKNPTGLRILTQGVKESLHVERNPPQYDVKKPDEESLGKGGSDTNASEKHVEIAMT